MMDTSDSYGLTPPIPITESASAPDTESQNLQERTSFGKRSVDFFGTTLHFMMMPDDGEDDFCVFRGVIPPGVSMPWHSHPDTEDFFILFGEGQLLRQAPQAY